MKAVIWTAYGPPEVLRLRDIPRPVSKDNQILVKVAVSNVFPGDCEIRRFDIPFPFGIPVRLSPSLTAASLWRMSSWLTTMWKVASAWAMSFSISRSMTKCPELFESLPGVVTLRKRIGFILVIYSAAVGFLRSNLPFAFISSVAWKSLEV